MPQLCWYCYHSNDRECEYIRTDGAKPIPGWNAKPVEFKAYNSNKLKLQQAFEISGCPNFWPDNNIIKGECQDMSSDWPAYSGFIKQLKELHKSYAEGRLKLKRRPMYNVEELRNAIIVSACDDWRAAYQREALSFGKMGAAKAQREALERFFRSEWFEALSQGLSPEMLIQRLEADENKKIKKKKGAKTND